MIASILLRLLSFCILVLLSGPLRHVSPHPDEHQGRDGFDFLPAGLHFAPLKANHEEARVGVFKYFGQGNLKVDIGNTIDVVGWYSSSSNIRLTAGIDFMAYAFATSAQGLRLQVDALDGFFGGNLSFSRTYDEKTLLARFRILHLSAHLVDGHYDTGTKQWLQHEPIPFTRDFGELLLGHEVRVGFGRLKYYGGLSYATLVRPAELERFAYFAGLEAVADRLLGNVGDRPSHPFLAYHFLLAGNPQHTPNHQIQVGVKFGEWHGKGVVLYLAYYEGRNFFSEYYYERVSVWGTGFTVDFP